MGYIIAKCIKPRVLNALISFTIVITIWYILSLIYNPLIVPSIPSVIKSLINIFVSPNLLEEVLITTQRLLIGLSIGIFLGLVLAIVFNIYKNIRDIFSPLINLIRVVPPVSWLVLAIIWFGFNGRSSIFIVIISTIPTIFICITEGIKNIDKKFLEMGTVFDIGRVKNIKFIVIPSIIPYFKSGIRIVIGTGWKVVVMGEVLTINNGIGGAIQNARVNISPEDVIAWSIVIIILHSILEFITSKIFLDKDKALATQNTRLAENI